MMNSFLNFLVKLVYLGFPMFWMIIGITFALMDRYDQAAYNMAAGAFFMIMPMYYAHLNERRW